MSTTSSNKDEQLRKLAEELKKAKSKTEIKRLNTQLDAILGLESSPEPDRELEEHWERTRRNIT